MDTLHVENDSVTAMATIASGYKFQITGNLI